MTITTGISITAATTVNLRAGPGIDHAGVGVLRVGDKSLAVVGGPVRADGLVWWNVVYRGSSAWIAEAVEGKPLIVPAATGREILRTLTDVKLLALLLWHEARGESLLGKLAVAHVALNRLRRPRRYGATLHAVITAPYQFSCFNDDNFAIHYDDVCMAVAELALGGATVDVSHGATHYHANYVTPAWAADMVHLATIGRHLFYRAANE